ncbi:hypothetical protein MMPV_005394 [Pyropia vietnamensis]
MGRRRPPAAKTRAAAKKPAAPTSPPATQRRGALRLPRAVAAALFAASAAVDDTAAWESNGLAAAAAMTDALASLADAQGPAWARRPRSQADLNGLTAWLSAGGVAGAGEVWSLVAEDPPADGEGDNMEGGKLVAARGIGEGELVIRVPHTLVVSVVDLMVAPDGEESEGEEDLAEATSLVGGGKGELDPAGVPPANVDGVPDQNDGGGTIDGVADVAGAAPEEKAVPPSPPPGDTLPAVRAWIQSDPVLAAQPSMALAVYVLALELAGDRTAYAPYLRALPSVIPLPLFFPPSVLSRLSPSALLPTLLRHLRTLAKHFLYLLTLLTHPAAPVPPDAAAALPLERFTWPAFCWAVAVAFTRQNALPTADGGGGRRPPYGGGGGDDEGAHTAMTLIPGWDMCNHADGPATTAYVLRRPSSAAVECSAMKAFEAGEEVTIFYGHRPAADFFLHSGFVPAPPPPLASAVPLDVPLPTVVEDPALPLKLRLLSSGGPPGAVGGEVHVGGTLTSSAVTAARAVALDRPGLAAALRAGASWERGAAVVTANEARALALLRAGLRNAVERYGYPPVVAAVRADAGGGAAARLVAEMLALERRMYTDAAAILDAVVLAEGKPTLPLGAAADTPLALEGCAGREEEAPVDGEDARAELSERASNEVAGSARSADATGVADAADAVVDVAVGQATQ